MSAVSLHHFITLLDDKQHAVSQADLGAVGDQFVADAAAAGKGQGEVVQGPAQAFVGQARDLGAEGEGGDDVARPSV